MRWNYCVASFCLLLTILNASVQCANVCDIRTGGSALVCNCDSGMTDEELSAVVNQEDFNVGALTFMNMIGCGLGAIICDNDGLPEGCNALLAQAAKAATLRSIILNDNAITDVPSFIKSMGSLEDLYLDNNKITDLRLNGFSGALRVKTMELDYNQLTRLRFGVFNGLNNLEKLILSNNMISTIDVGTFDALVDLKLLNLRQNSMTEVYKKIYDLPSLCQLTLADNALVKVERGSFAKPPLACPTPFVRGLGMLDGNPLRCPGLVEETGKYKTSECTCVNETKTSVLCNTDFMACDAICGTDRDRFVLQDDVDDDDNTNPDASSSTNNGTDTKLRSGLVPGLVVPGVMVSLGLVGYCYYRGTSHKRSRTNSIASSGTSLDQLDYALASGRRGKKANPQPSTRSGEAAETRLPEVGAAGLGVRNLLSNGVFPPVSGSKSRLSPVRTSPDRLPDMVLPHPAFSRSPPADPFASHDRRISSGSVSTGRKPTRGSNGGGSRVEPSDQNPPRLLGPSVSNDQNIASPVQTDYPRRQLSGGRLPALGSALQRGSLPPLGRMLIRDTEGSEA